METNTSTLTEETFSNSIEKYKASLFKLWRQSCEKTNTKIVETVNNIEIKNSIVDFNSKDDTVNKFLNDVFDNKIKDVFFNTVSFHNLAYHFTIDKKKLSISKMILELRIEKEITSKSLSKSLFSSKVSEKVSSLYLPSYSDEYVFNYFNKKSGNKLKLIYRYNYANYIEIKIGIPLLTYNNIFIPITFKEFEDLRCYELECRRRDDMENVYRHLTLLTPSEYKEFIMWKESQKIYEIKDSK